MNRYHITLDLDPLGISADMSEVEVIKFLTLALQKATADQQILATRIDVKSSGAGTVAGKGNGRPGRKPVNRPKIEAWIRQHIPVGESTQGTMGLGGVDREGKPLRDASNRIYPHRLAAPEPDGVGLTLLAIDKVLKELETEGYLERGFAAGSPFYEYVRELHPEGYEGPGKPFERASVREVDFTFAHGPEAHRKNYVPAD